MTAEIWEFSPAVQTWTPRVDQGATTNIAKTVTRANYWRFGSLCFFELELAMTAAGTAGSGIDVSLPLAGASPGMFVGWGRYLDDSASDHYPIGAYVWTILSPGNLTLVRTDVIRSGGSAFGTDPNLAIASGDNIAMSGAYRVSVT